MKELTKAQKIVHEAMKKGMTLGESIHHESLHAIDCKEYGVSRLVQRSIKDALLAHKLIIRDSIRDRWRVSTPEEHNRVAAEKLAKDAARTKEYNKKRAELRDQNVLKFIVDVTQNIGNVEKLAEIADGIARKADNNEWVY